MFSISHFFLVIPFLEAFPFPPRSPGTLCAFYCLFIPQFSGANLIRPSSPSQRVRLLHSANAYARQSFSLYAGPFPHFSWALGRDWVAVPFDLELSPISILDAPHAELTGQISKAFWGLLTLYLPTLVFCPLLISGLPEPFPRVSDVPNRPVLRRKVSVRVVEYCDFFPSPGTAGLVGRLWLADFRFLFVSFFFPSWAFPYRQTSPASLIPFPPPLGRVAGLPGHSPAEFTIDEALLLALFFSLCGWGIGTFHHGGFSGVCFVSVALWSASPFPGVTLIRNPAWSDPTSRYTSGCVQCLV